MPRVRTTARCVAAACALLFAAATTRAAPEPAQPTRTNPATVPLVWQVWPLFDPYVARRESSYAFGLDSVRSLDAQLPEPGWSLALGQSMTTLRPHMWVRLQRDFVFRVSQPSSYLLELSSYRLLAGLRAFGIELGPSVGLVPLAVDWTEERFGLSGLSPSAGAELSVKLGVVRVSLSAFEQLTWRWLGAESNVLQGVTLQVSLERPRVTKRREHPLIFQY